MARAKSGSGKRPSNVPEISVETAVGVIRKDYYADVAGHAESLIERIRDGEIKDREDFDAALHEECDSSQRVIYTFQSILGLLASENDDAYFEEGIGDGTDIIDRNGIKYEVLMYWALRADIIEKMEIAGYEPDADETYESSDVED